MTLLEYHDGIEQMRLHNPTHHLLSRIDGYSISSCNYLKVAMRSLPKPEPIEIEEEEKPKGTILVDALRKKTEDGLNQYAIEQHYVELRKMYTERARLSNQFHEVVTLEDRKTISINIQQLQGKIATKLKVISYCKKTGAAPVVLEDRPEFKAPNSGYELARKIEFKRQAIARAKTNLHKRETQNLDISRASKFLEKQENEYNFLKECARQKGF